VAGSGCDSSRGALLAACLQLTAAYLVFVVEVFAG
jgi:hypothetical protein